MMKEICTVQELAELLDIDLVSAKELHEGTIEFEVNELVTIASYKGITIDRLIKSMLE